MVLDDPSEATLKAGVEGSGTLLYALGQQTIALRLDYAHRYGDRSEMPVPIGVYAGILQTCERVRLRRSSEAGSRRGWPSCALAK